MLEILIPPEFTLTLLLAYNKWHETELERWLSDHDVPYPTPADRKDLENLVKENWQAKVVEPATAANDKTADHYHSVKDWIFDRYAVRARSLALMLTSRQLD
jgi:hypothetical protein